MKENLLQAILDWIEENLNSPLSQDDVIKKSGYSKRHFQDLFYHFTGKTIARYILARRLSLSATLLRLTSLSVLDISIIYQFNSQQNFSRAFKRYFKITPSAYRSCAYWDFTDYIPQHKYLTFPNLMNSESFVCLLPSENEESVFYVDIPFELKAKVTRTGLGFKNKNKIDKLKSLIKNSSEIYLNVYYRCERTTSTKNILAVYNFFEFTNKHETFVSTNGDRYYKFSFYGTWDEYLILSNVIYFRELSKLKAKKRDSYDIEVFNINDMKDKSNICSLDYFVPVV
ncbi:helix-turn-helix domain-containing protein [Proteus sp. WDL240414]|uniref:Helix-turn-helix domain-containing protein n=2 Tax=Proteus TaxID=583 RepID=A0A6I7DAZ7_9GAMM|nr:MULTISPECIES: helix-turn-helix domain-containing protein [Proteus]MBG2802405.1 helix-turn-helix domain-containing protein [Proteus mirabilis]MBG3019153.1 helix-turn-helix domain-containing protein [Proteus mirabilis]MBG3151134.1 helix-turn-helix domain-containing protein [Proteus mirabilis]QHN11965.1 helix-turn-helix domain-containing protein [Proteus columbae]